MKKLLSIILSIIMLLSMGTVAFADGVDGPMQKAKLTVGINAEFPPFEYYEGEELKGFDIDLMNYIGERIGFDIEFVNMSFDKLIPAVVNGEVDCAISGITITEQRAEVIDFTRPYLEANVTYNGEESIEKYGIVFPLNSINKARLIEASGDLFHSKYMHVDNAILSLKKDGTILKLIEKYELNSGLNNDEGNSTTYSSIVTIEDTQSSGRPADGVLEENMEANIPRYETWEEIGLTNPLPSEWAAKDVDYALAVGITDYGKDYLYKENITREEFCELIYNLIVLTSDEITAPITDSFTDTKNDKILMLNGLGIINGKSATEFAPNDYLTREEAATIIVRMVNKVFPMAATEMWFEYDDINEVSEWASDSIQTISNLGFMNGVGNNRFAPKDTYTTEQAIVTLVRVLESAGASGLLDENTSIGIIGGADGPTSIIVGDNVNVIEQEDYDNFYVEVKKNTTKVNDFYVDEAIKLITESGKLASDKDFISLYTTDDEMTSQMLELGAADYSKPSAIYHLSADKEQIIANIKALAGEEVAEVDLEKLLNHKKLSFAVLPSLINASYGPQNLAALTILTNSRGYVMPKDFKNDFALYFEYDGGCSALVTFSEFGDGVISANMSFVINGDKDNIFRRVFEITQGLGEDSIKIALVK